MGKTLRIWFLLFLVSWVLGHEFTSVVPTACHSRLTPKLIGSHSR
jgi:hypothetical protein